MGLNVEQLGMVARLKALTRSWCRLPLALGGRGKKKIESLLEFARAVRDMHPGHLAEPPLPLELQPFVAARAQYMKEEAHFCPSQWLPVFEAASFIEPRLLARDHPLDHGLPPMVTSKS